MDPVSSEPVWVSDVLVICADPENVDHLLALASASELSVEVAPGMDAVAARWSRALVVIVGVDRLAEVSAANLPRRPNVVGFGYAAPDAWQLALEIGAECVVEPPGEQGWLADRVAQVSMNSAAGVVVGVLGCRGGAGTSVFASALAIAAVRARQSPYLLDLDPLGCGLAVILGADRTEGLTWDQVRAGAGRIPARSLRTTMAQIDGIHVLGWSDEAPADLPPGVAAAVMDAARLSTTVTIVDLGRGSASFQREAIGRCDRVLMVVPADVRSVRSARRLVVRQELPMCEVVVRGPNPGGLTTHDVGQALGLPVLAAVAADRNLDQRLERGEPPGYRTRTPLARAGDGILKEVLG